MKPWTEVAAAAEPGGGRFTLCRRGPEWAIRVGGKTLMSSLAHHSEEVLADAVVEALAAAEAPRVLLGGLGFGFTLARLLEKLPADARIVVSELVPQIVAWNREQLASLNGAALADPRVEVRVGDVADVIEERPGRFNAVVLDVDNGPEALASESNARLYGSEGLRAARAALAAGGVLAVWSIDLESRFRDRLETAGFSVEMRKARAYGASKGKLHWIYLARRAAPDRSHPRRRRA